MDGLQYMETESSRPFLWNHIPTTTAMDHVFQTLRIVITKMHNPWFVRKHSSLVCGTLFDM
jgi:hypothetical protein